MSRRDDGASQTQAARREKRQGGGRRTRWRQGLSWAFGFTVLALLGWAASRIPWQDVGGALRAIPPATLALAFAVGVLSHLLYTSYDMLARWWVRHRLPWPRVMQVAFISYAFNLNLGSLVGGFALRMRLYARLGLARSQIAQVLAMALSTNWLGYGMLAGGVFLFGLLSPPKDWALGVSALRGLGAGMWLLCGAYLALCALKGGQPLRLRGHAFTCPTLRLAVAQATVSCLNWMLVAAVIWTLLQDRLPYPTVLGVLLTAAVAGVLSHVPAGAGVLEAVFVALLAPVCPQPVLLAALLAYRGLYYLLPLLVAALLYFTLEARTRHASATASASSTTSSTTSSASAPLSP